MNIRIVEWLMVVVLIGIITLILFGCSVPVPVPESEKDPLFWVAYKEVTGRNLTGELVTVKLPMGYRVCECISKIDSVEFECGECDLYN